jgi:uncharacterized heparinase superfamily protein
MANTSHISLRSRVSTPRTALDLAAQRIRDIMPSRPSGALPTRAPGAFHPAKPSLSLGDAEKAASLLAGQFHFAGQILDVGPWTTAAPSRHFADWLHRFAWLHDLLAVDSEAHHAKARTLIDTWIETYGRGNDFVFDADRLSDRLFNWLALWSPALSVSGLEDSDMARGGSGPVLERRRASVLRQLTALRGSLKSLPPGLPRITAGCALAMGGARMTDGKSQFLERGLDLLDDELLLQILPDGGHISRSPEVSAIALRQLLTLDTLLAERGLEGSRELSRAIDRLAPMVAFFRRAGGELAPFNGGGEMDGADIVELLRAAPGEPKAFGYGPHSGYQRLAANGTVALLDTGMAPPRPFDTGAHLAPLAMDLSTPEGPMITACGFNPEQPETWRRPVRAAAAHSTLILDNRSPGSLLMNEWKRRVVGDAVEFLAGPVKATRKEQDSGIWLECHHEGYFGSYGLSHRRRIFMPRDGHDIRGEDSLFAPMGSVPLRRDHVPFAIRFHVHPKVRVSLSQDQSSALLVVDGKAGWRFRTDGGQVHLEDSVYLATGSAPIKTQQIVIRGQAFCDSDGESRSNRVRWSFRKLKPADKGPRRTEADTAVKLADLPVASNQAPDIKPVETEAGTE